MKKIKLSLISLILVVSMFFLSCANFKAYSFSAIYFNTATTLVLDKNQKAKVSYSTALSEVEKIIADIENALSTTKENSDIYKFNRLGSNEKIIVSDITKDILELSLSYEKLTDGLFNIAVYPLADLWLLSAEKFGKVPFTIPSDTQISDTLKLVSKNNYSLTENTLTKLNYSETKLDLGGIAKGYAVDKIKEYLFSVGYTKGYINIGTSSMSLFDSDENWNLQIRNPRENETSNILLSFKTKNISLSTSGDYERFYDYKGKRYSHIIDPVLGKPIDTNIMSVTVLGENAALADVYTTALSIMGLEKAIKFTSEKLSDYQVFLTYVSYDHGYELYSNVPQDNFTLYAKEFNYFPII